MNFFAAVESDLARRIRRALSSGVRRMGTKSRIVAAILVCLMAAVTLPYAGIAQSSDDVDWEAVKTTPPEEWSEELKEQIVAAGYNLRQVAQRVRLSQTEEEEVEKEKLEAIGRRIRAAVESGAMTVEEGRRKMEEMRQAMDGEPSREERIWKAAMATDPDEWSDRLKAAILEIAPGNTIEEIADAIRKRQQRARTKLDRNDGIDWEAVKKTPPEEWSEELKAQIIAAGHSVETIAERVRLGQAEKKDEKETDLDAIGRRIRAAVESGAMTAEEGRRKMEQARQEIAGEPSREERIWKAAMATDPDEWSEELKAAILEIAPDRTIEKIAEGIRQRQQRQQMARESDDPQGDGLEPRAEENTAIQETSWGQVKKEISDPQ